MEKEKAYIFDLLVSMAPKYPMADIISRPNEITLSDLTLRSEDKLSNNQLEHFPKSYEVKTYGPDEIEMQHFIESQDSVILSEAAKNILERLEPNVHQFIPVSILPPSQLQGYYIGDYYYLKVCQRVQAVDIDKSSLKKRTLGKGTGKEIAAYSFDLKNLDKVCLREDLINGKHLWRGDNFCVQHALFISAQLKEEWEALGQKIKSIPCKV